MAGDHQINHPADGIVVDSPVGSVNDGSVDDKKHPETIIYDVKATTTNEKVAATGSDGYTDAEVGGAAPSPQLTIPALPGLLRQLLT